VFPGQVTQLESQRASVVSNLPAAFLLSSNPKDKDIYAPLAWTTSSSSFHMRNEGSKYLHYKMEMQQI